MKYKMELIRQYKALKMTKLNEDKNLSEQCMDIHAGATPNHIANARRHVVHAIVQLRK